MSPYSSSPPSPGSLSAASHGLTQDAPVDPSLALGTASKSAEAPLSNRRRVGARDEPRDLHIVNASRDIIWPHLGAVQEAQNSKPIGGYNVGGDEGRTRNDKLTRPGYSAGAAALSRLEKSPHGTDDLIVDIDRRTGVFGFNVFEDGVTVGQRVLRPDEPHDRP